MSPSTGNRLFCSPWFIALILFCLALPFYCSNNQFKFYYHPDESGKVRQLIKGKRNFNHPLLMLTTARLLIFPHRPASITPARAVAAGRMASALFAAATVAMLAALGVGMMGPIAGWAVGLVCLSNPLLFDLAHYMKEDPALAMGVAMVFLALYLFSGQRTRATSLFLGLACGFAVSAKYVGLLVLPFAIVTLLVTPGEAGKSNRWRFLGFFLLGLVLTCTALNYSIFKEPGQLLQSFTRETSVAVGGHKGLTRDVPHAYYVGAQMQTAPLLVSILAGYFIFSVLIRAKTASLFEWMLIAFPTLFFAMLSFSPKTSLRYFLPISTMLYCFAGFGAVLLARQLVDLAHVKRGKTFVFSVVVVALMACVLFSSYRRLNTRFAGFQRDDHATLQQWVERNLPPTAVIAQDDRVNLPHADRWEYADDKLPPQKVVASEFVADLGGLDELRKSGVTHVAVCTPTYARLFETFRPTEGVKEDYLRRRAFYQELFEKGKLVWSMPAGPVLYLEPGLALYEIQAIR